MFKLKEMSDDIKTKKFIEYNALIAVNNTLYSDGRIDESLKNAIAQKLKNDYRAYRGA